MILCPNRPPESERVCSGICSNPKDTRTAEQKHAMKWLIETLKKEFPIKVIAGHRDFSPDLNGNGTVEPEEWIKECPCFDVKAEF